MKKLTAPLLCLAVASAMTAHAQQDLYYDMGLATNSQWLAADAWSTVGYDGPFDQAWDNGPVDPANAFLKINSVTYDLNLGTDTVYLSDLNVDLGPDRTFATLRIRAAVAGGSLVFNNSTITAGTNRNTEVAIWPEVTASGNVTVHTGNLGLGGNNAFAGTVTLLAEGGIRADSATGTSADTNVNVQGGRFWVVNESFVHTYGDVDITSGDLRIGNSGTGGQLVVSSLSGSGGQVAVFGTTERTSTFTVDQAGNTSFSGNIAGNLSDLHRLRMVKDGVGTLTLNGASIVIAGGLEIDGGTVAINGGTTRNFSNQNGTTAITVGDGGMLAGTSTLSILGDDNVVVLDGGSLVAGASIGSIGTTTFSFVGNGALDLTGVTTASNWLHFDLGADTTAGGTYDQIQVLDGQLLIGSGILGFSDFSFNLLAGFDEGVYTLFSLTDSSLIGTLSGDVSGSLGGLTGTLSIAGDDLMLTVVPEPSTVALLLAIGAFAVVLVRRRKSL